MRLLALLLLLGLLGLACSPAPTATPTQASSPVVLGPTSTPNPCAATRVAKQYPAPPAMAIDVAKTYTATLHTSKGDVVIELLDEVAPVTVNNFVFLAKEGFYTCVPFHRVLVGFMVQTGDPTGSGSGSPGYSFADEPVTREYTAGTVAMANAGPNTNGSQFFIMHQDYPLPKNYTIFGQVREGMEAVNALATVPVTATAFGERSRPLVGLYVERVEIAESRPPG